MASKSKILVHTCCAPCSSYAFEKLISDGYRIEGYFFNPNIHPHGEYTKRLEELAWYAKLKDYKVIVESQSEEKWFEAVNGYESEKEGGARCRICYKYRLENTAIYALKNNFEGFTTVLTISPHKNSRIINEIGKELEIKYGISFLEQDFKKNDGFKKSLDLSKKHNLYRQNYCGCKFSVKQQP